MTLLLTTYLLLAHFVADFPLQRSVWVENKRTHKLRSRALYLHSAVVGLLTWLAIGYWRYWWLALIVAMSHLLIDWAKVKWTRNGPRAFLVDQCLHFAALFTTAYWFLAHFAWQPYGFFPTNGERFYPALITAFVFCIWPANYFIRETIKYCRVQDCVNRKGESLPPDTFKRSGALIGATERILVLAFILLGSYEAAGFTIAAKSLLRFNDSEGPRTEYVLAGTLMSILAALLCAVAIRFVVCAQTPISGCSLPQCTRSVSEASAQSGLTSFERNHNNV